MKVRVKLEELDLWDLEGNVEDSIEVLNKLKRKYPDVELLLSSETNEWDDDKHFVVKYYRDATKEEIQAAADKKQERDKRSIEHAKNTLKKLGVR